MRYLLLSVWWTMAFLVAQAQEPLRVCATTPDLGALARAVGNDLVAVTVLAQGPQDPHFVDARPGMVRACSKAEVLIEVGLELESGWLPVLVESARNPAIRPGAAGRIDASSAVTKRGVPTGPIDRSHGDVHPGGNPHFLVDPLCGLQVAALLRDRFTELRPAGKEVFDRGVQLLRERLAEAMIGTALAKAYDHDAERLALAWERSTLLPLLKEHGDTDQLAGWFGALQSFQGAPAVADHDGWPYFAARFGLQILDFFEPKPGVAPSTAHLSALIDRMREHHVGLVLSTPYFAPQHAEFVAQKSGAKIAHLAHQTDALPDCTDYVTTIDHNVRAVVAALGGKQP